MIFRQLFDTASSTYTYLLATQVGGEALIIDPVLQKVDRYLQLLDELGLKLAKAIDTHLHADHVTGLGALRDATRCITVMSEHSRVDTVSMRVADGDRIRIEGIALEVLYTPGHTSDSCCFAMSDRVFTGDTLLIRGTGRTDFQGGDARAQYRSIVDKLLALPDATLVYPAHDYKGDTVSTIGEERAFNPRLQAGSIEAYAEMMGKLNLPDPAMMDVAVPANMRVGLVQEEIASRGWAIAPQAALQLAAAADVALIDLREADERTRDGVIPGSLHLPYNELETGLGTGGRLRRLADVGGKRLVFYCTYGERSAMAVMAAQEAGLKDARHLHHGLQAWRIAGGALARGPERE